VRTALPLVALLGVAPIVEASPAEETAAIRALWREVRRARHADRDSLTRALDNMYKGCQRSVAAMAGQALPARSDPNDRDLGELLAWCAAGAYARMAIEQADLWDDEALKRAPGLVDEALILDGHAEPDGAGETLAAERLAAQAVELVTVNFRLYSGAPMVELRRDPLPAPDGRAARRILYVQSRLAAALAETVETGRLLPLSIPAGRYELIPEGVDQAADSLLADPSGGQAVTVDLRRDGERSVVVTSVPGGVPEPLPTPLPAPLPIPSPAQPEEKRSPPPEPPLGARSVLVRAALVGGIGAGLAAGGFAWQDVSHSSDLEAVSSPREQRFAASAGRNARLGWQISLGASVVLLATAVGVWMADSEAHARAQQAAEPATVQPAPASSQRPAPPSSPPDAGAGGPP